MPAHDATDNSPAHTSDYPESGSRMSTYMNIDKSGVSMSWRTAIGILIAVSSIVIAWTVFASSNATKSDVSNHNISPDAHPIILDKDEPPVPMSKCIKDVATGVRKLDTQVKKSHKVMVKVKNGFYEDRAERLADRAVEKIRDPTRSRRKWKAVKEQAIKNLEDDNPIRQGLEDEL